MIIDLTTMIPMLLPQVIVLQYLKELVTFESHYTLKEKIERGNRKAQTNTVLLDLPQPGARFFCLV